VRQPNANRFPPHAAGRPDGDWRKADKPDLPTLNHLSEAAPLVNDKQGLSFRDARKPHVPTRPVDDPGSVEKFDPSHDAETFKRFHGAHAGFDRQADFVFGFSFFQRECNRFPLRLPW
jgi:hypothetical protein